MTQVDFYVLEERATGDRFTLACRLVEKAWKQGRRVYLHTGSEAESLHMDRLLWIYREGSFLPHGLVKNADPALNPVLIGNGNNAGDEHDVLVNLASEVPGFLVDLSVSWNRWTAIPMFAPPAARGFVSTATEATR